MRALALGVALFAAVSAATVTAQSADLALAGELTQAGWARGIAPRAVVAISLNDQPVAIAPDGRFLLAFDRDAAAAAQLTLRYADGRAEQRELAIAPRAWQIERVGVDLRPGKAPSAEWAARRAGELAVSVGDTVRQGQYIGRIGATGRATGPHLHWSIKWRDARLDPLLFTGPMPAG